MQHANGEEIPEHFQIDLIILGILIIDVTFCISLQKSEDYIKSLLCCIETITYGSTERPIIT